MRPLTRAEVRAVDMLASERFGISGLTLMENAGHGCTEQLLALGCSGPVAIFCGKGNNGGDGLVIARLLHERGVTVRVLLFGNRDELSSDAAANYQRLPGELPVFNHSGPFDAEKIVHNLGQPQWTVDALLGTGSSGSPRPPLDQAIRLLNEQAGRKMAIDIPSGLDCETGIPAEPTFRADHTCTFVAPKVGFDNPAARTVLGEVHVIDIGVPPELLNDLLERHRPE